MEADNVQVVVKQMDREDLVFRKAGRALRPGAAWLLLACLLAAPANAQTGAAGLEPYRVGPLDELSLSIPQQGELDRSLTVDERGIITVPLIGEVEAAGRTLPEIEGEILERVQVYHRNVTRVALEVTAYNSRAIYVLGSVHEPGKYALYPVPNVWQAIREAGGITVDGDLSRVRVFRQRDGRQVVETHNLAALLAADGVVEMPALAPGETVEVPTRPAQPGAYAGADGVYVMGQVLQPGVYRMEAGANDMLGFILRAGGPTNHAKLDKVHLLRPRADGGLLRFELDIERYLDRGDARQNPQILPGDTIYVPEEGTFTRALRSNLGILTSLATLATTLWLISDRNN